MRIHHLYVDEAGETHFKDFEVEYEPVHGGMDQWSNPIPVKNLIFRETSGTQDFAFHNAPRRQFCINLDVGVQVTVSDGETRYIGPGEVFLLEDTTGKGHMSKNIEGKLRHSVFITLE
jgi:hypothetical protein